ncbi:F-box-like protein [Ceratobasidium sp. AG-Ba]|nr:F-box-like protein [Ceratobasidium sp. AG-Ba]
MRIQSLPTEVLAHVFEFGTASPENESGQDDFPFLVSLVCRAWHTLALATPTLWNTLVIADSDLPPVQKLKTHLTRSKSAPLNLYLDFSTRAEPDRVEQVMKLLVPQLERWRHLVIVVPAFDVMYTAVQMIADAFLSSQAGAGRLEVLRLYGPPEFDPSQPEPRDLPAPIPLASTHNSTPRLRDVVLCGIPVDWSTFLPTTSTLERLQLSLHSGSRRPLFAHFARLITSSPNLHTLILNASGPALPASPHETTRVQLDHLRSLTLDCFDPEYVESLLKRISTPALETLALADAVGESSRVFEVLAAGRSGTGVVRTDSIGRSFIHSHTHTHTQSNLPSSSSSTSIDSESSSSSVFPRLTTLKISSVECTPASFRQLVRGLPNLTNVKLDARDADPTILDTMAESDESDTESDVVDEMERICPQLQTVTCTGVPGSSIKEFVEKRIKGKVPVRTVRVCVASEEGAEEDGRNWLSAADREWLEKHVQLEFFDEDEDEEIDGGAWWSTWDA